MNDYNDISSNEDFEVEISDLEPDNRISHFVASMWAFRSHFSVEGVRKDVGAAGDDFELEISDLPADEGSFFYKMARTIVRVRTMAGARTIGGVRTMAGARTIGGVRTMAGASPATTIWALRAFGLHVSFKWRWWRVACSGMILVLLVLLLGYVPRDMALRLFAQPTSMSNSVPGSASSFSSSIGSVSIEDVPGSSSSSSGWVGSWTPQSGISQRYTDSPPLVADNAVLGPVPGNCPSGPTPRNFNSGFPPGIGEAPLWVTGFTGFHAELTHLTRAKQPRLGWYSRILLVLETGYKGPVSLLGENMQDGSSLWFGDSTTQYSPRKTIITLHPDDPAIADRFGADEQWAAWPVYVYIPAAGCYYLVALWGEEHWVVTFAAGYANPLT